MLILLAEDEAAIREGLVALLTGEGYEVMAAADGEQALKLFAARKPDLLLLDVMMPKLSGYDVCERVRREDELVPIVFLTAKDAMDDELHGLGIGADDYISKTAPLCLKLARIASALRRAGKTGDESAAGYDFAIGSWRVDGANCRMVGTQGQVVTLGIREVELLRNFAQHEGELFSRDFLLTRFWGGEGDCNDNVLTVCLSRLRDKLGNDGHLLHTLTGRGYFYQRQR